MNDHLERLLYDILEENIPTLEDETDQLITNQISETVVLSQTTGLISGVDVMTKLLYIVDDSMVVKVINGNGSFVEPDDIIAIIKGKTSMTMRAVPIAMHMVSLMSGIASTLNPFLTLLEDYPTSVFQGPLVTPLFSLFEQYAFVQSGGKLWNQEYPNLSRLTQTHFEACSGVQSAVIRLLESIDQYAMIAVEVRSFDEYVAAISSECDMIILHEMPIPLLHRCLATPAEDKIRIMEGELSLSDMEELLQYRVDGIRPYLAQTPMRLNQIQHRLDDTNER